MAAMARDALAMKRAFSAASELMDAEDFSGAITDLSEAVELGKDHADDDLVIAVLSTRAYCHTMVGAVGSAERDFDRVVSAMGAAEDDPILPPTLVARSVLHRLRGREDASARDVARAKGLGLRDAEAQAATLWAEWAAVPAVQEFVAKSAAGGGESDTDSETGGLDSAMALHAQQLSGGAAPGQGAEGRRQHGGGQRDEAGGGNGHSDGAASIAESIYSTYSHVELVEAAIRQEAELEEAARKERLLRAESVALRTENERLALEKSAAAEAKAAAQRKVGVLAAEAQRKQAAMVARETELAAAAAKSAAEVVAHERRAGEALEQLAAQAERVAWQTERMEREQSRAAMLQKQLQEVEKQLQQAQKVQSTKSVAEADDAGGKVAADSARQPQPRSHPRLQSWRVQGGQLAGAMRIGRGFPSNKQSRGGASLPSDALLAYANAEFAPGKKLFADMRQNEKGQFLKLSVAAEGARQHIFLPFDSWTHIVKMIQEHNTVTNETVN